MPFPHVFERTVPRWRGRPHHSMASSEDWTCGSWRFHCGGFNVSHVPAKRHLILHCRRGGEKVGDTMFFKSTRILILDGVAPSMCTINCEVVQPLWL